MLHNNAIHSSERTPADTKDNMLKYYYLLVVFAMDANVCS